MRSHGLAAPLSRLPPRRASGAQQSRREQIEETVLGQARRALAMLAPHEQRILRLRFGIDEASELTAQELGRRFAVPSERIRQIEVNALRKLRHPSRSRRPWIAD